MEGIGKTKNLKESIKLNVNVQKGRKILETIALLWEGEGGD